jgi:ParB family chromosome partitioning protein
MQMSNISKKSGLGRGLNSLLGGYSESAKEAGPETKQDIVLPKASIENSLENTKQTAVFHAESSKSTVKPIPQPAQTLAPQVASPSPALSPAAGAQAVVTVPVAQVPDAARIWKVAIDKLVANQNQPRQVFREEKLKELSESIKEQGILQPIVARKLDNGKFEIVSGERRWRASQMAGLHDVPVILRTIDDKKSLELAIIENVQRDDLNAIEEADAYQKLSKEFFMTQEEIAKRVGKERATVANLLRLLQLDSDVRQMIMKNELSQGHAKVLLSVQDAKEQKALAKKAVTKKWSVRQLEKEIKGLGEETKDKDSLDMDLTHQLVRSVAEDLQKQIGTKVQIDYSEGKGKISLYYYSDDQLTQITDKIKEAWL